MENTTGNGFAAFHSLPAVFPNFHAEADADFHRCGFQPLHTGCVKIAFNFNNLPYYTA